MHFHLIRLVSWPNGAVTHKGVTSFMKLHSILCHIQLNEFETDPYFLQLSQNMATNYLFTFVFLTKKCHEIAWRHKIHVRLQKIF